jgi:hypothetical protein
MELRRIQNIYENLLQKHISENWLVVPKTSPSPQGPHLPFSNSAADLNFLAQNYIALLEHPAFPSSLTP